MVDFHHYSEGKYMYFCPCNMWPGFLYVRNSKLLCLLSADLFLLNDAGIGPRVVEMFA